MKQTKARAARWRPLAPFSVGRNARKHLGIYSREDFLQLIHYERVRADRSNQEFSLVVFETDRLFRKQSELRDFVATVTSNVRTIDHVGWFEKGVGVLLPVTSRLNAVRFARAMRQRAITEVIPFAIYSYPESSAVHAPLPDESHDRETRESDVTRAAHLYDAAGNGRLRVSERLKSVFATGVPVWKRSLDIFGSSVGIILLSPLFLVLALYIKAVSKGPVFYRSSRIGRKGRSFTFYKFRTMHANNDQEVHSHHAVDFIRNDKSMEKLDDRDPRIIPGGRVLRKLAIDELPQLFNIFVGQMSLVGPRPCIPYEAKEYLRWHAHRFDTLPGLTGLWQVSGKNKLTFQQMIRLDITYMRRMSLAFDLYIIAKTPFAIAKMVFESLLDRRPALDSAAELPNIVASR